MTSSSTSRCKTCGHSRDEHYVMGNGFEHCGACHEMNDASPDGPQVECEHPFVPEEVDASQDHSGGSSPSLEERLAASMNGDADLAGFHRGLWAALVEAQRGDAEAAGVNLLVFLDTLNGQRNEARTELESSQEKVRALSEAANKVDEALTPWFHDERIDSRALVSAMADLIRAASSDDSRPQEDGHARPLMSPQRVERMRAGLHAHHIELNLGTSSCRICYDAGNPAETQDDDGLGDWLPSRPAVSIPGARSKTNGT